MTLNPFLQTTLFEDEPRTETGEPIMFWKRVDSFGEFSQWYPRGFVHNDKEFATAEQFMMYAKAVMFKDTDTADMIINSPHLHPSVHKEMGRSVRNFNEAEWTKRGMDVVVSGNFCKFMQDYLLREKLLATEDRTIVEASPHDRIWGIGFDSSSAMMNVSKWGQNKLGKALMQVRDMIWEVIDRMPAQTKGKIPITHTMILCCFECLSVTSVVPIGSTPGESVSEIFVTTCSECVSMMMLPYGLLDTIEITNMIRWMPDQTQKHLSEFTHMKQNSQMIMHPYIIRILDARDCTVTKLKGLRDANGQTTSNWNRR